jgi:hypothetical protein
VVSAAAADPALLAAVAVSAVVADPALLAAAVVAAVSARVEAGATAVVVVPTGAVALTGEAAAERGVLLARRYPSRARSREIYFRSKLTSI